MHSRFIWRDQREASYWMSFARKTAVATVCFFTGYSLVTASFLQSKFDQEYMTDAFKSRVFGMKTPLELEAERRKQDPQTLVPLMRGRSSFTAFMPRADAVKNLKPDIDPATLLDSAAQPVVTTSTAIFLENVRSPVRDYDELARSTHVGDVLLTKGTGNMSWKITNLTYAWQKWDPWALRYSHAAVVVDVDRSVNPPEVYILEAVDNRDASVKSRGDGVARHRQVQVVNARDRIFSLRAEEEAIYNKWWFKAKRFVTHGFAHMEPCEEEKQLLRRCYSRAAWRRLERRRVTEEDGEPLTPEEREKVKKFAEANIGRPIDKSPKLSLAQLSPSLYKREDPNVVSCTELIVDLFRELGLVVAERDLTDPKTGEVDEARCKHLVKPSLTYIPFHFTPKGEREWPIYWNERGTRLGPEQKIFCFE